jgi:hypothetical protein
MLSVKPSSCWRPQETFLLYKTNFYQCVSLKWTNTYALAYTAHNKDFTLSHQSYYPNYNDSSHQEGHPTYLPFDWAKNNNQNKHTQKMSLNSSPLYYQRLF